MASGAVLLSPSMLAAVGIDRRRDGLTMELIRTTFARVDFESSIAICHWLQDAVTGSEFYEVLWTSLAVIYWRPFTDNDQLHAISTKRFGRFDDDRLSALHEMLRVGRHSRFAHTEINPGVQMHVFPPGGWAASGAGDATATRIPYSRDELPDLLRLCELQRDRAADRIRELVGELYGDRSWEQGTTIELMWPERNETAS